MQRMQSQLRNTLSAQNGGGEDEERSLLLQAQVPAQCSGVIDSGLEVARICLGCRANKTQPLS